MYSSLFLTETLQITDAGEADAGGYECVVENAIGFETSQNAKLYVKGTQYISITSNTSLSSKLGDYFNLEI